MNLLQPIKMLLSAPPILGVNQSHATSSNNQSQTVPKNIDTPGSVSANHDIVNQSNDQSKESKTSHLTPNQSEASNKDQSEMEESVFSSPTHRFGLII